MAYASLACMSPARVPERMRMPVLPACFAGAAKLLVWSVLRHPNIPACAQVGQPMVRVATGKLQLSVVVGIEGATLLVAVVVPSRVAPGTTVARSDVKCAAPALFPVF